MAKKSLVPFASHFTQIPRTVGGSKPIVQSTAQALASSAAPMAASRIYAPPSIVAMDDSDPRYTPGKSDNVENIYLPLGAVQRVPRSGAAQLWNWFTTGRME